MLQFLKIVNTFTFFITFELFEDLYCVCVCIIKNVLETAFSLAVKTTSRTLLLQISVCRIGSLLCFQLPINAQVQVVGSLPSVMETWTELQAQSIAVIWRVSQQIRETRTISLCLSAHTYTHTCMCMHIYISPLSTSFWLTNK